MDKPYNIRRIAFRGTEMHHYQKDCILIEEFTANSGSTWQRTLTENKLVFTLEGVIDITYKDVVLKRIEKSSIFLLSKNTTYEMTVSADSNFMAFCLSLGIHISDLFPLVESNYRMRADDCKFFCLPGCEEVTNFLLATRASMEGGANIAHYYEFKFRELLVIMKQNYSMDELTDLFCPVLSDDSDFITFVLENHEKVKTAKELADLSHYSLSAFKKLFKEKFGVPPYEWMRKQKCMRLLDDITNSDYNLKEISDIYGFSSMSQMTTFCKNNLGKTPRELRSDAKVRQKAKEHEY